MKKISKIMLIDDDYSINFLHKLVINSLDLTEDLIIKENGKEALNYLLNQLEADTLELPDLIFLDLEMPIMDGVEFLEHYQQHFGYLNTSQLIIASTSTMLDDQQLLAKYHFLKEIVSKPIKRDKWESIREKYGQVYQY